MARSELPPLGGLEFAQDLPVGNVSQVAENQEVIDILTDESHRTVAHQIVGTADMVTSSSPRILIASDRVISGIHIIA